MHAGATAACSFTEGGQLSVLVSTVTSCTALTRYWWGWTCSLVVDVLRLANLEDLSIIFWLVQRYFGNVRRERYHGILSTTWGIAIFGTILN